jgi:hypothetical protein
MKTVFIFLLLTASLTGFSQDTTKVEQYCQVIAEGILFSNKVAIDIQYGEARNAFRDYRLKDEDGKVKKFNSLIDGLNYLGKQGWKLVNAFPIAKASGSTEYHYIFKREFDKADVD